MAKGYSALVAPETVQEHLRDRDWVLFDCRHQLTDKAYGQRAYREAHLPGARFADIEHDLSSPITPQSGRHPLPDMGQFADWVAARGVSGDSQVVAYDDSHGGFAARLWWMLRFLGHERAAVLDGGFARWKQERRPLTPDLPHVRRGDFASHPHPEMLAELTEVERLSAGRAGTLVDARAGERYRGETEPIDPRAGHIPGALNLPFLGNVGADGRFLPAEALQRRFAQGLNGAAPEQTIHYCGSGVTACHNLLAMAAAGLPPGRLYVGSWSQWSKDPARPAATGPTP